VPISRSALRLPAAPLLLAADALFLGLGPCEKRRPKSAVGLFVSPLSVPVSRSGDARRLDVANAPPGTLSLRDVANAASPSTMDEIHMGLAPVGVAVLSGLVKGDELVLVVHRISDTIRVISRSQLAVIQTIQALHQNGVRATDEPVGIAFSGPSRALVTLDQPERALVLDGNATGYVMLNPECLPTTAQAPRALSARDGQVYRGSFELGNQTEFPIFGADDNRPLVENDNAMTDEGCERGLSLIRHIDLHKGAACSAPRS